MIKDCSDFDETQIDTTFPAENPFYQKVISALSSQKSLESYRDLCLILDEPVKSGNSRIAQEKQFKYYFNYHYNNKKITVDNILPKPIIPYQTYNSELKSLLITVFCQILIEYQNKYPDVPFYITSSKLANLMGCVNDEFLAYYHKRFQLTYNVESNLFVRKDISTGFPLHKENTILNLRQNAEKNNSNIKPVDSTDLKITNDFYERVSRSYKPLINEIIDYLERKHILYPQYDYYATFVSVDNSTISCENIIDEFGDSHSSFSNSVKSKIKQLSDDQLQAYIKLSSSLLRKYDCNSFSDLYKKKQNLKYQKELQSLSIDLLGFSNIFPMYKFSFTSFMLENEQDYIYNSLKLNSVFKDHVIENKEKYTERLTSKVPPVSSSSLSKKQRIQQKELKLSAKDDETMFQFLCDKLLSISSDIDLNKYFSSSFHIYSQKDSSDKKLTLQQTSALSSALSDIDSYIDEHPKEFPNVFSSHKSCVFLSPNSKEYQEAIEQFSDADMPF